LKHRFEEFRNDVGEALCDTAGDIGRRFSLTHLLLRKFWSMFSSTLFIVDEGQIL